MSTESSSLVQGAVTSAPVRQINCSMCGSPLSPERLTTMPESKLCVPCLESVGDVPLIRRFDEFVGEDKFELFYTSDEVVRFGNPLYYGNIPWEAFNAALGDDQLLTRGGNQIVTAAYGLSTAFEPD